MTILLAEKMTRKQRIENTISAHLNPLILEVLNESHKHHVPDGSETHFKVLIVTEQFMTLSRIERHRLINNLLADELKTGLHALTLHLHTPIEWETRQNQVPSSPACRDGYHHG